jgi:hypothetical protein
MENSARQSIMPIASGALDSQPMRLISASSLMLAPISSFPRSPEEHDEAIVVEAIHRAQAYAEAGADGLFAPGLADIVLIARLAEASPLPLNIMVGDSTPPMRALVGYWRCTGELWSRPILMVMKALEEAARAASATCERFGRNKILRCDSLAVQRY